MVRVCVMVLCAAAAVLAGGCAGGGRTEAQMAAERGVVFDALPTGEKFAVYVPRGDAPQGGWPCIVFLNGRGECGTDGQRQLTQGLLPAVLNKPEEWPFVIVFPQKPKAETRWVEHDSMVMGCLAQTEGKWTVDKSRVYLTGLSQGGRGTWEIGSRHAEMFAAVAPVCGFGEPADVVAGLGATPVWAYHGEKDDVVKPEQTRRMVAAIATARGVSSEDLAKDDGKAGTLRMTIYQDLNHGCWDRSYRDSGMPGWLLRFRKPAGGQ